MATFPRHPSHERYTDVMFDEDSIEDLSELKMQFRIYWPTLEDPQDPTRRLGGWMPMSESDILQEHVPNMIQSTAMSVGNPAWIRKAAPMMRPQNIQLILCTTKGRILRVPWKTRVGDLWAGARWPRRDSGSPMFEDLRQRLTPRVRPHELDGVNLNGGYHIELFVMRNEEVGSL